MPPKVPNSKFKPKLVSRTAATSRNEGNEAVPQGSNSNALGAEAGGLSSHDGNEAAGGISSVHLRRLQQRIASGADAALGEMLGSSQITPAGGASQSLTSSSAGVAAGRGAGGGGRGSSAVAGKRASAASFSSAYMSQMKQRQQEADLDEDLNDTSEMLPVNSMSRILMEQHIESQSAVYRPVPLENLTSQTGNSISRASQHQNQQHAQQQDHHTESTEDGHAFLQEHLRELEHRHQANKKFFLSVSSGNTNAEETGTKEDNRGASSSNSNNNNLVWLQLPRFHQPAPAEGDGTLPAPGSAQPGSDSARKAPLSLAELPTGKIGELKLYKSGRAVLEINGVFYDVNADSLFGEHGDGSCNTAAAILPGQQRSPDERAGCYELGILQRKLVCAPTWSTGSYHE